MITIFVQLVLAVGTVTLLARVARDAHRRGKERLTRDIAYRARGMKPPRRVDPAPAVRHLREHKDWLRGVSR